MACRLFNCSPNLLRIDLRGGETLHLAPGATSAPLREELLYENQFLPRWERTGVIARLPARFEEVQRYETHVAEAQAAKPSPAKKSGKQKKEHSKDHKESKDHSRDHKEHKKTSGEDAG